MLLCWINEILHGKRAITADAALPLGRFFGLEPGFWMNLQTRYDMERTTKALNSKLNETDSILERNGV